MNLNWISLTNFINTSFLLYPLSLPLSLSLQSVCTVDICLPEHLLPPLGILSKSSALAALLTMSYSVEGSAAANPYQPSGGMQTMMVQTQSPVLPPQQQSPAAIVTLPPDFNLQQGQGQDQGKFFLFFFLILILSPSLVYSTNSQLYTHYVIGYSCW
jgi:hypothetical protein